jgi:hypothetical protein
MLRHGYIAPGVLQLKVLDHFGELVQCHCADPFCRRHSPDAGGDGSRQRTLLMLLLPMV